MTNTFTVEYRNHALGERVLLETDDRSEALREVVRAGARTDRTLIAFDLGTIPCRGWGEDCGTPVRVGVEDLCPDCTVARLDSESPRIPV